MCGIVGQLRPAGQTVDPELLARMCAALEHRGPDSRGLHHGGRVGLGIQRLRVIDLSTGDQPIYNEDGSVVVVLNGEIYNFRELRDDLARRGHRFATQGDTEVIVHLYEEYGADCVRHLHGMFAFALWDERRQQLLLARDRVGKKPLLYALRDGVLSFASEMQALLQDTDDPARGRPRRARLLSRPRLRAGAADGAARRAQAARRPTRSSARRPASTIERYWALDYAHKLDEPVEELCERIREGLLGRHAPPADRRRAARRLPVGRHRLLGGRGGDGRSSPPSRSGPSRSASTTRPSTSSRTRARSPSQFGTEHHEFVVRADAIEILPQIVRHYGEPFADSSAIPCFYLAELTRRHVTVALNGDGGDESFARLHALRRQRGGRAPRSAARRRCAARWRPPAAGLPDGGDVSSVRNRVRRLAGALALDAPARYARYVSWFDAAQRGALYSAELRGGDRRGRRRRRDRRPLGGGVRRVGGRPDARGRRRDLPRRRPDREDRHRDDGPRARGALAVPRPPADGARRLDPGRAARSAAARRSGSCARRCAPWLPGEILDRPKQGFSVPLSSWLRNELQGWARDILLDPGTLERGYFEPEAVDGAARPPRGRRRRRREAHLGAAHARALAPRVRRRARTRWPLSAELAA